MIQVVVKGKSGSDNLYLITESRIIQCVQSIMVNHVQTVMQGDKCLCSALHEVRKECTSLSNKLGEVRMEVQVHKNLVGELGQQLTAASDSDGKLQRLLDKECQKSKLFWKQKCDPVLAHEDILDEKDAEITTLQKQVWTAP